MVIHTISVWGERCSGTNFLHRLLQLNFPMVDVVDGSGPHWKHGYPGCATNPQETLHVWIVRDMASWLTSLFRNPYHYYRAATFGDFLRNKLKHRDDEDNDQVKDPRDRTTPLDLRYRKARAHRQFWNTSPHAAHVHMKWLQCPGNDTRFVQELVKRYNLPLPETIARVPPQHLTKQDADGKNKVVDKGHEKWMTKSAYISIRPMIIKPIEADIQKLLKGPRFK